ncbi:5-bromo-4-chloroindolyl phosphate hydrolysis family protein [Virgibacillus doumboii]|uniref:5-bromo-4-chloroindolyl phosphate hydrolysis family protein n=1 Tax=Virgibacillus doumboii TaxID=2697503 RepID=UPI001FEB2BF9|nr:5-bromo-4-chloroindolyl phosphate hydrolysis family protein [Virgibacillus doumboii]
MMKQVGAFLLRSISSLFGYSFIWLISFFALEQGFLFSVLYGVIGRGAVFFSVKGVQRGIDIKRSGLKVGEYRYITRNLKEAKKKISRLQKTLFRVRNFQDAKQNLLLMQIVRKIYANTKKEPERFYKAERFYYKNLDSLVEIAEKYTYLQQQPAKNAEMSKALADTRDTMHMLTGTVNNDLHYMLRDDMEVLDFEMEAAKRTISDTNK